MINWPLDLWVSRAPRRWHTFADSETCFLVRNPFKLREAGVYARGPVWPVVGFGLETWAAELAAAVLPKPGAEAGPGALRDLAAQAEKGLKVTLKVILCKYENKCPLFGPPRCLKVATRELFLFVYCTDCPRKYAVLMLLCTFSLCASISTLFIRVLNMKTF